MTRRKFVAVIKEALDNLDLANVDELGQPTTDPGVKLIEPTTPLAPGVSEAPLQRAVKEMSRGHSSRHQKRVEMHRRLEAPKPKFEAGTMMQYTGETELTSSNVNDFVRSHEKRKSAIEE